MQMKPRNVIALVLVMTMMVSAFPITAHAANTTTFPAYYSHPDYGDYIDQGLAMTDEEIDRAIEALLNTMTLEEKYSYLGGGGTGTKYGEAGGLPGTPRLGVPETRMHDGPSGVLSVWPTSNTPNRQMVAATWDTDLAYDYGTVLGSENRAIGASMQLGSQYDITRTPEFGRANDQLGEDPYLLAQLATDETKGMQDQGVMAVGKHYAVFAQSASPASKVDIQVSEQAIHEVYLPGFEYPIKEGNMLGLMSSYNAVNGDYASSNTYLQLDVLRDMWGYQGFTVTDWGGNDGFTLNKGTDIEMPSLANNSRTNTESRIPDEDERNAVIDNAVGNVLYAWGHAGYLALVDVYEDNGKLYAKEEPGRTEPIKLYGDDSRALEAVQQDNNDILQKIAEGGGVLLKNEGDALPIDPNGSETVAVLGLGGSYLMSGTGGERSYGVGYEMTSPYEALVDILGAGQVTAEPVFDTAGTAIPAGNLYHLDSNTGTFQSGAARVDNAGTNNGVDTVIEFLPAANSFKGGDAFAFGEHYTWTTYVQADETGTHKIIMHGLGGSVSATVTTVGFADETEATDDSGNDTKTTTVSYSSSQGAQWHSGDFCTDTGMSISSGVEVDMEAGKYYKIEVNGNANYRSGSTEEGHLEPKDMQLRLAWLTPSTSGDAAYNNALTLAENNDKVVVFVTAIASNAPSSRDETNLNLSEQQEQLILDVAQAAHDADKQVIVVANNETAITMYNWIDEVDAVMLMYRPGQKGGVATANLLTGIANPSGRLAYVIPRNGNETIITCTDEAFALQNREVAVEYPSDMTAEDVLAMTDGEIERMLRAIPTLLFNGITDRASLQAALEGPDGADVLDKINNATFSSDAAPEYYEGILTGYRWYDTYGAEAGITPLYDFGYGLSYTKFSYSDLEVTPNALDGESVGYDVTFTVTNTGSVAGSEVAQVYIGQADLELLPEGIQSAPVQLVGFAKIKDLGAGTSETVTIHLNERAFSYWDSTRPDNDLITYADGSTGKWTVAEGNREIYVGAASDNLLLRESVTITGSGVQPDASPTTMVIKTGESQDLDITFGYGAVLATIEVENGKETVVGVTPDSLLGDDTVQVAGKTEGEAELTVTWYALPTDADSLGAFLLETDALSGSTDDPADTAEQQDDDEEKDDETGEASAEFLSDGDVSAAEADLSEQSDDEFGADENTDETNEDEEDETAQSQFAAASSDSGDGNAEADDESDETAAVLVLSGTNTSVAYDTAQLRKVHEVTIKVTVSDEVEYVSVYFVNGNDTSVPVVVANGSSIGNSRWPANPTRDGYTFQGWFDAQSGGTQYTSEKPISVEGDTLTLYAQWKKNTSGNGSSGGSGKSSGGSSVPDKHSGGQSGSSAVPSWAAGAASAAITDITEAAALAAVDSALSNDSSSVQLRNPGKISLSTLQAMAAKAGAVPLIIHADSMSGNAVDVRLYIDPAKATVDMNLVASTVSTRAATLSAQFANWFSNTLIAVSVEQDGSFGQEVEVAVKLSSELADKDLVLYSYNRTTHSYSRLSNQTYRIDSNGYIHFTVSAGGDYIISDGALVTK